MSCSILKRRLSDQFYWQPSNASKSVYNLLYRIVDFRSDGLVLSEHYLPSQWDCHKVLTNYMWHGDQWMKEYLNKHNGQRYILIFLNSEICLAITKENQICHRLIFYDCAMASVLLKLIVNEFTFRKSYKLANYLNWYLWY